MSKTKQSMVWLGLCVALLVGSVATSQAGKEGGGGGASSQLVPGAARHHRSPTARVKLDGVPEKDATTDEEENAKIRAQEDGLASGATTSQ